MSAARHAVRPVPHCIPRAKERYGLDLIPRDLSNICRMVQSNQAKLDARSPSGTTSWFLTYLDTPIRVVISPDFYKVVTFLPLDDVGKWRPPKAKRRKVYRGGRSFYVGANT